MVLHNWACACAGVAAVNALASTVTCQSDFQAIFTSRTMALSALSRGSTKVTAAISEGRGSLSGRTP